MRRALARRATPAPLAGLAALVLWTVVAAALLMPGVAAEGCNDWKYERGVCERAHHGATFAVAGAAAAVGAGAASRAVLGGRRSPFGDGDPIFKEPRDYDGRENVWDPSIAKQREMWETRGVVWDPDGLKWREPTAGDFPPPENVVETPFTEKLPRSEVPFKCLGLYDAYTTAQATVVAAEGRIEEARRDYQFAVDEFGKQYLKAVLALGYDTASVASSGASARGLKPGQVAGLGPRDVWLSAYDGLQARLRQALQAATAAAERAATLARQAAEAAAEALSRTKAAKAIQEGIEEARQRIAQLTRVAEETETRVAELEAKEAVAKQVKALEAEQQKAAYEALNAGQKRKALGAYVNQMRALQDMESEFKVINARINSLEVDHNHALADIARRKRILDTDPSQAAEIARLEVEAESMAQEIARLQETSRSSQEWKDKMKAAYDELVANPAFHSDVVNVTADDLNHVRREMDRLLEVHKEAIYNKSALETQADGLRQTLGGAPLETIGKELEESRAALGEAREAIQHQEDRAVRLEGDAPVAMEDAEAARRTAEEKERAVKAAQDAVEEANQEVASVQEAIAGLGPEPSPGEPMSPGMLQKAGDAITSVIGGSQSGAEMGAVLRDLQAAVAERKARLGALEAEREAKLREMREAKPRLDACIREHATLGSEGR